MSFGYVFNQDTCVPTHVPVDIEAIPKTTIEVISYEQKITKEDRLVFDLINAPPSHANALRRSLLSMVPSVAIEIVGISKNDGIMPDEMLAHRLGLIPLDIDPKWLKYTDGPIENDSHDIETTLLFGLHVIGGEGEDPDDDFISANANSTWETDKRIPPFYTGPDGIVLSKHLIWLPFPDQKEQIPAVHPLFHDIPITKLRPRQEIELTARAIKSNGKDHAKFSPVCTAFYRMIPLIEVDNTNLTKEAKKDLVKSCPRHIFQYADHPFADPDIEDLDDEIIVQNPRTCTSCRECLRKSSVRNCITLGKVSNRYEFTVESVGVRPAYELVKDALTQLMLKCDELRDTISEEAKENDE